MSTKPYTAETLAAYLKAAANLAGYPDIGHAPRWQQRLEQSLPMHQQLDQAVCPAALAPIARPTGSALPSSPWPQSNPSLSAPLAGHLAALGRQVNAGQLDPVLHVQTCLHGIARHQDFNLFVYVDAEGALRKAEDLKRRVARGAYCGPLAGVVLAVKDCIPAAGLPFRAGSLALPQVVPQRSAPALARLEAAGAIVIGMANMQELAYGGLSTNKHFGAVGHPQDPDLIPGGSSGGSAAAVALGVVDAALGTDSAGSVRMPAALCGVVGYKPTYDLVPCDDVVPLSWSLDHVGPLTRSVADAALLVAIMAGLPPQALGGGAASRPAQASPRLFWPEHYGRDLLQPDVRQVFQQAITRLEDAGVRVERGELPELELAPMLQHFTMTAEAAQVHDEQALLHADLLEEDLRIRLETGYFLRAVDYIKAQRLRSALKQALTAPLHNGAQALLLPTVCTTACPALAQLPTVAGGTVPARSVLTRLTYPFNLAGMPAISIPCGVNAQGLSVGLQLVGRFDNDAALLDLAAWLQTILNDQA
jgi:aspartyl-tRNA(Asn)/glutamyl-tRNA(Gln) amidotransferase subunit A